MPSIRHLEAFRALARHRHFGKAAQALGVTQPALSRTLLKLEGRLGGPLFDRKQMSPTIYGEAVLRFAEAAVVGFAELTRELDHLRGVETGGLTVSMGPYPADISGRRAAAVLSSEHPRLAITLRVCDWSGAMRDVIENVADVALAEISEAEENPKLETQVVREAQGHFFCSSSHPLARRQDLALSDLLAFPWVGPSYPARIRAVLPNVDMPFGVFDPTNNRFSPRIVVDTFSMARELVLNGHAISAFVPGQLEDDLEARRLIRLAIEVPELSLRYGFITKRGRALSPSAEKFIRVVREIENSISRILTPPAA